MHSFVLSQSIRPQYDALLVCYRYIDEHDDEVA